MNAVIQLLSVCIFTIVETEHLFVEVTEQVKRFHAHISTRNPALEKRPKILKAIRMHAAIDVLDGMVPHRLIRGLRVSRP